MTDEMPELIVNYTDVEGLMPGENIVEFDSESGEGLVTDGPDKGKKIRIINPQVLDSARLAMLRGVSINDAAKRADRVEE